MEVKKKEISLILQKLPKKTLADMIQLKKTANENFTLEEHKEIISQLMKILYMMQYKNASYGHLSPANIYIEYKKKQNQSKISPEIMLIHPSDLISLEIPS